MNIKTIVKLQFFAVFATLVLADNLYAQSFVIPTVAVVQGDTAEIPLEFVAGGGATNFDFTMSYDPAIVDESSITFTCNPIVVGMTSLTCTVDTTNNQVKGIGVNLPLTALTSGEFAVIRLPVLADASTGLSVNSFAANFAANTTVTPFDTTWAPNVRTGYCNANTASDVSVNSPISYEACEILVVGPSFIAEDGASVFLSSGWEIEIMPNFLIETGATLNADVCGQSLCETSASPMPDGCHSCVVQICDIDAACCATEFDQSCLDKVNTVCGLVCE